MITSRLSSTQYFMHMAHLASLRGSCARRQVGCILVDRHNHVIATGYNGPPSGVQNCIERPCPGARAKSGESLDLCQAVHAEQNALLQCHDVQQIVAAYSTTKPCIHCIKLLMNTSCQTIYYTEDYPHKQSEELWSGVGRQMIQLKLQG